jgi:putative ABC transport system substrate-binding protein
MFTKRFLLSLFLILALLSGCSQPPAETAPEPAPATTMPEPPPAAEIPTEVPTLEPTAEPTATAEPEKFVIGMMTIASHPSLDAVRQGVKDALAEAGFEVGKNLEIIEGNAEGDMATLSVIAQQFIDEKVTLIVATSTPAMQAAFNATQDLQGPPVFFNAVSNPYAAGIATTPEDHPAWVIGNQLLDPVKEAMALILQLRPDVASIGAIYNPAEANSVYLIDLAQKEADAAGITLEVASVGNTNEVQAAAEALVGRGVQAVLAISDNTLNSAFEPVVQIANDNDILLVGTSASQPPRGAAASYGINPYEEGMDSGRLIAAYLKGEVDIAATPIMIQDAILLTLNPAAALEQGAEIPADLLEKADKVIE